MYVKGYCCLYFTYIVDDMMDVIAAIIAGSLFGAITIIILILLAVVGTVAYVKGMLYLEFTITI